MIKSFCQHALLVFFGIGTVVVALEVFGRLLPADSLPGALPVIAQAMRLDAGMFYRRDAYFRHTTGANLDLLIQHRDFIYRVKTKLNLGEVGFRGGTRGGPVWGVAVGDSLTFGIGVDQDATWVAQLTDLLGLEILNLGVPGWGPQQYTRAIERYSTTLKPKTIFYGLYKNDLQDVLIFDKWLRADGYLRRVESFLRRTSISFNLCRLMWNDFIPPSDTIYFDGSGLELDSDQLKKSLTAERNSFHSAWSLVKLYFPSKLEAYWNLIRRKDISLEPFDDSVEIFSKQVANFCRTRQISCLDLTPPLRIRAAQGVNLYFAHDLHWTETGNRVVATEIYNFLTAQGIPQ
jgi:acetyltransferase AlgX (SGNH hydrolase-like protein)